MLEYVGAVTEVSSSPEQKVLILATAGKYAYFAEAVGTL
jgi:hypothetical protein